MHQSLQKKVTMGDEVEVRLWLLMHHPRRFLLFPWCISKLFVHGGPGRGA
jgi:hypothetical protein